jgi:DMSO/TMAO reductase YedYZ molybdopterin-dependent catalytic subunit
MTRRKLLAAAGGAAGLGAVGHMAAHNGLIPPDWAGVWGPGETLTYALQRAVLSPNAMAREFDRGQISKVAPVSGPAPKKGPYQKLQAGGFVDWRLKIEGLVDRPATLSLADLKELPATSQITEQACEEGWCFIAEWKGVRLSHLLKLAGAQSRANFVVVFPFDDAYDSIDMADAMHPQTLIAYGMNGADLPADHGAPARLKVPRQLGYKSVKYLSRVLVTDTVKNIGKGLGSIQPEEGYSWYAGI